MNAKRLDIAEHIRRTNSGARDVAAEGLAEMIDYRHDEHRVENGDVVSAWALAAICVTAVMAIAAVITA